MSPLSVILLLEVSDTYAGHSLETDDPLPDVLPAPSPSLRLITEAFYHLASPQEEEGVQYRRERVRPQSVTWVSF